MSAPDTPPTYILDPPANWRRVALDEMDVLYHRPSGQTHILIEPAPQILDCLAKGPASAADIQGQLSQLYTYQPEEVGESQDSAPIVQLLTERLEEMVGLGFVRYAASTGPNMAAKAQNS